MIQPDSQPEGNLSTAQSEANLLTPTNFGKFWHSFRLFPFRFGEYAFTHWYLFTIGLFGVLLILDLSSDLMHGLAFHHDSLYYFLHNFHNTATYGELTDWIYITGVVAVSLIALTFNGWRSSIPTTFQELLS